ncbi:MAG: hypothetical protein SGI94_08870 [Saprospiraceae bacterium]|nr:hypothetical protein [Saprospiraceae bacterium]
MVEPPSHRLRRMNKLGWSNRHRTACGGAMAVKSVGLVEPPSP